MFYKDLIATIILIYYGMFITFIKQIFLYRRIIKTYLLIIKGLKNIWKSTFAIFLPWTVNSSAVSFAS